jgi:hypothetical protein
MVTNCPCCGLAIRESAAVCPLCNERLIRVHFRARHYLSALLALEVALVLLVLV